jgi:hypothetical protein
LLISKISLQGRQYISEVSLSQTNPHEQEKHSSSLQGMYFVKVKFKSSQNAQYLIPQHLQLDSTKK